MRPTVWAITPGVWPLSFYVHSRELKLLPSATALGTGIPMRDSNEKENKHER